jgi:hypothetical protein
VNQNELIERLERADHRSEPVTFDRDEVRALLDLIRALSDSYEPCDFCERGA